MRKFKGTIGRIEASSYYNKNLNQYTFLMSTDHIESFVEVYTGSSRRNNSKLFKEAEANADLIADSFNTITQCDLLPSELLSQRNELMEFAKKVNDLAGLLRFPTESELNDLKNSSKELIKRIQ